MARRIRFEDDEVDEDELREMIRNEIQEQLVTNGPTGNLNPDDEYEEDDEDCDDEEEAYYGAAVGNSRDDEDDDDEGLDLPVFNNKKFAPDLKLHRYEDSDDEDEEDDDGLDLPHYNPAAFKIR